MKIKRILAISITFAALVTAVMAAIIMTFEAFGFFAAIFVGIFFSAVATFVVHGGYDDEISDYLDRWGL